MSPAVEAPDGPAVELLLRFTRAGHEAGYPTADLEERLSASQALAENDDAAEGYEAAASRSETAANACS